MVSPLVDLDGHVCTITLNRPQALNAFNPAQVQGFSDACVRFRDDPDLWVAVITGAGDRAFSAGADIKELLPRMTRDPAKRPDPTPPTIMRGMFIPKPIIAAVNGVALGGGMEVALACDLRIASTRARFGQPEINLGAIPGWGGTQRLPRAVPAARAMELLLTGDPIDAATALQIGLVNAVVEPDALLPTAYDFAARICAKAPLAVQASKEAALRGLQMPLAEGLELERLLFQRLAYTDDIQEGVAAFVAKRPPAFSGS